MNKENLLAVKAWLDSAYPTYGDGCWSTEYIAEVAQGKHEQLENTKLVWQAIKAVCPSAVSNYAI
jgi:hypothetical protein